MNFTFINETKIIAHRGACANAPENTLISFQKAHEFGAKWVEFDVMLTKDGEAIVIHDDTVDRTTNGHGNVADLTLAEIKCLDAGSWFSNEFIDVKIPTFIEVMQLLNDVDIRMNVEIKPTPGMGEKTAEKTIELLYQYWPMEDKPVMLSSLDKSAVTRVREMDSTLTVGRVLHDVSELITVIDAPIISVNHELLDEEFMGLLKPRFDMVFAYTVNDRQRAQALYDLGVASVFTDHADLFHENFLSNQKK